MGASENSELLTGREYLPLSCDSVTGQPSLTRKEDLKCSSLMVSGVVTNSGLLIFAALRYVNLYLGTDIVSSHPIHF